MANGKNVFVGKKHVRKPPLPSPLANPHLSRVFPQTPRPQYQRTEEQREHEQEQPRQRLAPRRQIPPRAPGPLIPKCHL